MKIVRSIFLHSHRIEDLILTLKFDFLISPTPAITYIFYGPFHIKYNLYDVLNLYGIDTKNIIIQFDHDAFHSYYHYQSVDIYKFGGWISQQLIKFMAIDTLEYDYLLIQDCDTFSITPYHWLDFNGLINMYYLPYQTHSLEYYEYVKTVTGQPRQTPHCFATEFMPISKLCWSKLKKHIEDTFFISWFIAIYKILEKNYILTPNEQLWFSEYEILGNWNLICEPQTKLTEQKRFELVGDWKKI